MRCVPTRRSLLVGMGTGIVGIAGCVGGDDDSVATDESAGDPPTGDDTDIVVETVTEGLAHPWGIAFVPEERELLVTERDSGQVLLLDRDSGSVESLDGTPAVDSRSQGGLLDVTLHPTYPEDRWVYLTYSAANDDGETATHVGRGWLDRDAGYLEEFEVLHIVEPFVDSTGHYGSRVVSGPDGMLYVTTGDRQFKDFGPEHVSQDTTNELGATLRLEPDGSIPPDNPFVDDPDVRDAIYSYGHRNAQGMAVHPSTGELWQSEHGERDGDELNVIEAGGNYGWPIAHYGCEYGTEEPVGEEPHERDAIVDPVYYWECTSGGFPPAGMTFYDGDAFPDWHGDLFVGNLAGRYLARFTVDGHEAEEVASLLGDRDRRIRDVAVAPDTGHIYVAVDAGDAPLVRLVPA